MDLGFLQTMGLFTPAPSMSLERSQQRINKQNYVPFVDESTFEDDYQMSSDEEESESDEEDELEEEDHKENDRMNKWRADQAEKENEKKYPSYVDDEDDGTDPNLKDPVEVPWDQLELRPKGIHLYTGMQEKAGKSNMCSAVAKRQWETFTEITDLYVLCPGGKTKSAYGWVIEQLGEDRIIEGGFIKALDTIIQDNFERYQKGESNLLSVIVDDGMGALNMRNKEGKKIMERIGASTRHREINIIFHLCCQNVKYPPPEIRDNAHFLFMGKSSGAQVNKAVDMQDTYDNNRLKSVVGKHTKNYQFVMFDKLKSRVCVTKAPLLE